MSAVIAWMAAEAEGTGARHRTFDNPPFDAPSQCSGLLRAGSLAKAARPFDSAQGRRGAPGDSGETLRLRSGQAWGTPGEISERELPAHSFPAQRAEEPVPLEDRDEEQERRVYRGRTVAMLRRYMKYSMETGRLPSLLGQEFFRARVTAYTVVTFEDRVIFVHDMETCLDRLDEFSRQLIARHILQEHDRYATARLLHCNKKTVRRWTPLALDQLSEILLEVGLMERVASDEKFLSRGFRP